MTDELQSRGAHGFGVVGLGASAGGLAALQSFFGHTPAASGLAYVVVMHLSPEHESHLAALLQAHTELKVTQVTEDTALEPDHVFVIPPNRNLATIDSHLRLSSLEENRRERAPIDYFFRALAASHREQAVAVVLSGTGSDGSVGLRRVKEAGGLTLAQNPGEAEYPAMPQSAINTGQTDLVLDVRDMPAELVKLTGRGAPPLPTDGGLGDDGRSALQQVFGLLYTHTGHDFDPYKPSTVLRRLARRMQLSRTDTLPDYLALLRRNPEEVHNLHQDLLISVTNFFRNPEAFEVLEREVVPKLFADKLPGEQVRVWAVGCATGEEAYSLAMLLLEAAETVVPRPPEVQVFASDVSESALAVAREGYYPDIVAADVSAERLQRFFTQEPGGGYRVNKEVRSRIVFAQHNLLTDPPFSRLDLLVCRNMLIYLKREVQDSVFDLFYYALHPEGYLFLGGSESLEDGEHFRVVDKTARLFQRRRVGRAARVTGLPLSLPGSRALPGRGEPLKPAAPHGYGALHARLAERYAPPSVLVTNDERVVHYSENAGRYLRLPGGEPTGDLLKLVRDELRVDLRAALHRAQRSGETAASRPVTLLLDGAARQVVLTVTPVEEADLEGFVLVTFTERALEDVASTQGERGDQAVDDLERELETSRDRLRSAVEEHENYEEEMRTAFEELQSTNEELQSTAEELETSQEELQSINEELVTLNQENQHKVEELSQLSSDLQNLLGATDIATLFLDRDLRIKRFTPRVSELFNILGTDRDRPLADLTHRLGYETLIQDAAQVLKTLQTSEREVRSAAGAWFLTRILPYRTVDDRIDGVVITFVDISDLKQAGQTLQRLAAELTVAEQRERDRIARILHDDIQQLLFSVLYKVKALGDAGTDSRAGDPLSGSVEAVQRAISTARTLAAELSPPVVGEGLAATLRWLVAHMSELHKLDVTFDLTIADDLDLAEERRMLLFHTARELLFNVVKHAPDTGVGVEAFVQDGDVVLIVKDRGDGFDTQRTLNAQPQGFGLATLRQRLQLLGGSLDLASAPGQGTQVTVTLPAETGSD